MAVNSRIISGNLDSPEGGIDGLLQAVVCQDVSLKHTSIHTYTHTHMHKHMHTHMYTRTHTHAYMHTLAHASIQSCSYRSLVGGKTLLDVCLCT